MHDINTQNAILYYFIPLPRAELSSPSPSPQLDCQFVNDTVSTEKERKTC